MRYSSVLLMLTLFLAACSGKQRVPGDIVPVNKMQNVLWDIMKSDEFIIHQSLKDSALKKHQESIRLYKHVLNTHNISEEDFKKSMNFYQKRPDLLKIILDSLQKKADRINIPPAATTHVK